ncbi:MAG: hybrid sensor histidine kinase/response regulator [Desulfobulbaceae bacterium]|nr:hybrid sensor histidine kinase/response regulator [Desulfobulbaceae bacterium]
MTENENLLDEFVAESREHIELMERGLLELENNPKSADREEIAVIFRSIHSIKGAAGFLGQVQINRLSHVMETLLSRMRDGEINPDQIYIDALFAGVDQLSTMVNDIEQSNEVDISGIYKRLVELDADEKASLHSPQKSSGQSHFVLQKLPENHANLFSLTYDLDALLKQDSAWPVMHIQELASAGDILAAGFSEGENIPDESHAKPQFHLLYSTIMEEDVLHEMPNMNDLQITPLTPLDILCGGEQSDTPQRISKTEKNDLQADRASDAPSSQTEKEPRGAQGKNISALSTSSSNNAPPKESSDTIRIQVSLLDRLMALAGELVLVRNQHIMAVDSNDAQIRGISQRLDIVTSELQEAIMRTRMQPIGNVFGKLPRMVRDLSHKLDKEIDIKISGNEVEVDKTILEALSDPLTHLIRNCCDHGIEMPQKRRECGKTGKGSIHTKAYHEAGKINIVIQDDGQGIDLEAVKNKALTSELRSEEELEHMSDKELLSLVLLPGFSTTQKVSDVSGRGVGMDVVKTGLEQFGGILELDSFPGIGTTVKLQLPLTLAIIPCLVVIVDNHRYAIPQVNLKELVCLYDDDVRNKVECAGNQELYRLRDKLLPLVRFKEVLQRQKPFTENTRTEITDKYCKLQTDDGQHSCLNFAVVKSGNSAFGLIVDQVLGTEEIVVKPMHQTVKHLSIYSGATVMGDGQVALILDIEGIANHAGMEISAEQQEDSLERQIQENITDENEQVLLFKYGSQERFAVSLPLIKRIEHLPSSRIEKVGDKEFATIDNVSTRILRLDQLLTVSPGQLQDNIFLLLPKYVRRPFGIVINELLDIEQTPLAMNGDGYNEDGLLGSAITDDHLTLFLDVYRLIEKAEPDWFEERRRATPPPEEQKSILLVEDMPFFRKMIKGYLEADNYKVLTAEHGLAGLEILSKNHIDLIVSDLEMPEMDGWTFISKARSNGYGCDLPALALSSLTSTHDRTRAMAAGFNEYEVKINREDLLTVAARLLQNDISKSVN